MKDYSYLITDDELSDISYVTNRPHEVVHPRINLIDGVPCLYHKEAPIPLTEFLTMLAEESPPDWVGAYRKSDGKKVQTTITFAKTERLSYSDRLQAILADIQSGDWRRAASPEAGEPSETHGSTRRPLSLAELEARLCRQREIGRLGEDAAYRHEFVRLANMGCPDPAQCMDKLSVSDAAAGYDLRSDYDGVVRCIEVKSSTIREDSFFLSENERTTLLELGVAGYIYLVRVDEADSRNSCVIREICDPFNHAGMISLEPTAWMAKINDVLSVSNADQPG